MKIMMQRYILGGAVVMMRKIGHHQHETMQYLLCYTQAIAGEAWRDSNTYTSRHCLIYIVVQASRRFDILYILQ